MKRCCPICGKKVSKPFDKAQDKPAKDDKKTAETSDFFPFCSKRCKLIDLNGWFEDKYVISTPVEKQKNNSPDEPEK